MFLLLTACSLGFQDDSGASGAGDAILPPEATLHRLSDRQWRNAAEDVTGVRFTGELPGDYVIQGYAAVGGSEVTIAPTDLELYEAAAWAVAVAAVEDGTTTLGCAVDPPLGEEDRALDAEACLRGWLADTGLRAWRRPVTALELDTLVGLVEEVMDTSGSGTLGAQAGLAALLVSPHFVFRVDRGVPDPAVPGRVCFTGHEAAARLSFLLWDSGPDAELLAAADAGDLETPEGIRAEAERLLDDPRARSALADFWSEYMDLDRLATVSKDATLYPQVDDAMRTALAEEVRLLFDDHAFGDLSILDLWTTDLAWVNAQTAPLYGTTMSGDALQRVRLTSEERGGLLGRAAFLFLNAHATVNSPTHRGRFVRDTLLCQDIPPPPAGLDTTLETVEGGTLRDELEQHMTDPSCGGCHELMDPIGFGLEYFDPIGQRRELDNGQPIDATGDLDGTPFDGAAELGEALAAHSALPNCLVQQVYRHAQGALPRGGEHDAIDALTDGLLDSGGSFRELLLDLVTDQVFRTATDSGAAPPDEAHCDAQDDDGDGQIDESLEQACAAEHGLGTRVCASGSWSACAGPPAAWETCDGSDEDADGVVDEGLAVDVVAVGWDTLTSAHGDCSSDETQSGACYAATHRTCGSSGCTATGWGPVVVDDATERSALLCLDATEGVTVATTYSHLASIHGGCNSDSRLGRDCNAAISRFCSGEGLTTGFGPLENSGDDLWVACTPHAAYIDTTYSSLSIHEPACDGSTYRDDEPCNEAIHRFCRQHGYVSGYGPLENSEDIAHVACVGTHPEADG